MLCMLVPGIVNMENVFVTPLAETEDRGEMLEWILKGISLFAIPVMAFSLYHASPIVRALFERGSFTAKSTSTTADALSCYTLALPFFIISAMSTRLFLISGGARTAIAVGLSGVFLNAGLNGLLTVVLGMGLRGVAQSTTFTTAVLSGVFLMLIHRRTPIGGRSYLGGVILPAILSACTAVALTTLVPELGKRIADISVRGILFVGLYLAGLKALPIAELRRMEEIVFRAFFRRTAGG